MKTKEQKALLKKCRHRAEIPVTIVAIVLTVAVAVLIVFLFGSVGKNQQAEEILIEQFEYEQTDIDFAVKCGRYLLIAIVVFLFLKLLWELFKNAGIAMVNDIPFEEKYDPKLYKEYQTFCEKLGIREIPKLLLAADKENLESTGITIKSEWYLRMDLSSVDIAGITGDDDVIRFEVLHDLAHIAYHHYHYALLIATVAARWIPIVKSIYNRVMCYSADRLTAELISREECITVFLERYMQSTYESERRDEYIKRLKDQKLTFTERLSAALYNLTQDTPSYPDRIRALMDERNHGRVV